MSIHRHLLWLQILCERLFKVHEETKAEERREPSSKEEQNQAPAVLLGLKKPGALVTHVLNSGTVCYSVQFALCVHPVCVSVQCSSFIVYSGISIWILLSKIGLIVILDVIEHFIFSLLICLSPDSISRMKSICHQNVSNHTCTMIFCFLLLCSVTLPLLYMLVTQLSWKPGSFIQLSSIC